MTFAPDLRDTLSGLKAVYRLYARFVSDADRRLAKLRRASTERRILIELGYRPNVTDVRLARALGVDRSQLSRSLRKLVEAGLIAHEPSPHHSGQRLLSLSPIGEKCAAELDTAWSQAIEEQIAELPERELSHIVRAAPALIDDPRSEVTPYNIEIEPLRQTGLAWMLAHASGLYEMADLATAISRYIHRDHERIGFAARHFRQFVGTCMIVVNDDDVTSRIRGFTVDPAFRSAGVARRLLSACISEAKEKTLVRVTAFAGADDRHQDLLFREHGFKRVKGVIDTNRREMVERIRKYELSLPVSRRG